MHSMYINTGGLSTRVTESPPQLNIVFPNVTFYFYSRFMDKNIFVSRYKVMKIFL